MSKFINILITVDTDKVKKDFSNPSQDSGNPTRIPHDGYGYMVASGTIINSGQGTALLDFNALVGDDVRAFAVSGSDNFEDAVLLYGMPRFQGDQVMSKFIYQSFEKSTVVAGLDQPLPARIVVETFWFFQASVSKKGTESYQVQFVLYTRDANTGQPVLYGYFEWDPTIRVAG